MYDHDTGLSAINPTIAATFEVYTMPGFSTIFSSTERSDSPGTTGSTPYVNASFTEWMMPDAGESLYFGYYIDNNHLTQNLEIPYWFTITLIQRKEA
jgi:hypothetical protein